MPINVLLAKKNVRLARKKAKKMGSPEVALFFLELITVNDRAISSVLFQANLFLGHYL